MTGQIQVRVTRKSVGRAEESRTKIYPKGSVLYVSPETFKAFRDRLEKVERLEAVEPKTLTVKGMEPETLLEESADKLVDEMADPVDAARLAEQILADAKDEPGVATPYPQTLDGVSTRAAETMIAKCGDLEALQRWGSDSRSTIQRYIAKRLRVLEARG